MVEIISAMSLFGGDRRSFDHRLTMALDLLVLTTGLFALAFHCLPLFTLCCDLNLNCHRQKAARTGCRWPWFMFRLGD